MQSPSLSFSSPTSFSLLSPLLLRPSHYKLLPNAASTFCLAQNSPIFCLDIFAEHTVVSAYVFESKCKLILQKWAILVSFLSPSQSLKEAKIFFPPLLFSAFHSVIPLGRGEGRRRVLWVFFSAPSSSVRWDLRSRRKGKREKESNAQPLFSPIPPHCLLTKTSGWVS